MVLISPALIKYLGLKRGDHCKIEDVSDKEIKITFG